MFLKGILCDFNLLEAFESIIQIALEIIPAAGNSLSDLTCPIPKYAASALSSPASTTLIFLNTS